MRGSRETKREANLFFLLSAVDVAVVLVVVVTVATPNTTGRSFKSSEPFSQSAHSELFLFLLLRTGSPINDQSYSTFLEQVFFGLIVTFFGQRFASNLSKWRQI